MDGRFRPRTTTSRPIAQRPPVERSGNLIKISFGLRPDPIRIPTTGWYHAEAIRDEADRQPF